MSEDLEVPRARRGRLLYICRFSETIPRSGKRVLLSKEKDEAPAAGILVQTASAFDGLDAKAIDKCFLAANGHYSARGNGIVAEALARTLVLDDGLK